MKSYRRDRVNEGPTPGWGSALIVWTDDSPDVGRLLSDTHLVEQSICNDATGSLRIEVAGLYTRPGFCDAVLTNVGHLLRGCCQAALKRLCSPRIR